MNITKRLEKLEKLNPFNVDSITAIFRVIISPLDDHGKEINFIRSYSGHEFSRLENETVEQFQDRADTETRRLDSLDQKKIIQYVGKNSANTESLEH